MLSILLVDDERLDREGLYQQIVWKDFDITQVYLAKNGREAVDIMHQNNIDILLTDISMPGMSGLELAQIAVKILPQVKTAFISGYDDFSYAQKAIKLNAYDYILKPVKTQSLINMLCIIIEDINKEAREKRERLLIEDKAYYLEFINHSQILYDFLIKSNVKQINSDKVISQCHIQSSPYITVVFEIDDYYQWEGDSPVQEVKIGINVLHREIDHNLSRFHPIVAQIKPFQYVIILCDIIKVGFKISVLEELMEVIKEKCSFTVTMSISNRIDSFNDLPDAFYECCKLLAQKFLVRDGKVIEHSENIIKKNLSSDNIITQINKEIDQSIKNFDTHRLSESVQSIFEYIDKIELSSLVVVCNLSIHIISHMQFVLMEENISVSFLEEPLLWEKIINCGSIGALKEVVTDYFNKVAQLLLQHKDEHQWIVMTKIINYIKDNYSDDVTLKTIAPNFYYSPNHLGLLFKELTGKTFYEYLTKFRMEIAAELLKDPSAYIYEVANKVSYKNTVAFTNQFKKEYGLKPSEYSARYRR